MFKAFIESMEIYEIWPRRLYMSKLIEAACEDGSPFQKLCLMMIFGIVGEDMSQFNTVSQ